MEVYHIEQENMVRIDEVDVDYEKELEERLVRTESAEIGGVEILYIGRQGTTEHGKKYDLVGADEEGNLTVVELKQGNSPRRVIAQALDYVGRLRYRDYDELQEDYQEFRRKHDYENSKELREVHRSYFDLDEPLSPDEFNTEQRIVIIGASFDDSLTNMADYLRDKGGIDVILVQYGRYRDDDQGIELLTTSAVRRPLSEEPAAQSDNSIKEWKNRRREFWKDFQAAHQEYDLTGGYVSESASYGVWVYESTSGDKREPAYIRPKVGNNSAHNAIRFYEGARQIVTDDSLQEEFQAAVDEAASALDLSLPSHLSDEYDFEWNIDQMREYDLLTITHQTSGHNKFQDEETIEEIQEWLIETTRVFKHALEQMEEKNHIVA